MSPTDPVARFMATRLCTVATDDTVEAVERTLENHRLSAVPVVDGKGALFGIISSADVVGFHAAKKNAKAVKAWELCTYRPHTVGREATACEVAQLMLRNRIHHVPVVENGTLVGIVSSFDFVEHFLMDDPALTPAA